MITYKTGDIFKEKTEAIVNPVNCVGVAGAGLALAFRKKYPSWYDEYRHICKEGLMKPGQVLVFRTTSGPQPRTIISVPTKRHYRDKSKLDDIEIGVKGISMCLDEYNIHSVSVPALGCGLGGLDWSVVRPIMENKFREHEYKHIVIFEPR